jgi:CheY-like chemotaxis protein
VDFAALDKALQNLLKPAPEPERKKRVLAVDDDPDQLHFMRSVFERRGVEFVGVQDPVKMLEAPPQGRFDVILLDVMMPGVDGLELCRRFRADPTTADTHIVMVTAEGDAAMIKVAEKFGADGYLQKPVRPADLLGLIGLRPAAPPPPNIAAGAPSPTVQAGPIRQPSGSGRPRVLVVDDDRDILNFVAQVFGRAGIAVHAVSDAKEIKNDVPQGGYDLILMDVFMPGVTGIELLRDIVRDVRNLTAKMVVITAHDDPQLRALAQKAGADQYLVKPLAPRQLLGLLEELPFAPEA